MGKENTHRGGVTDGPNRFSRNSDAYRIGEGTGEKILAAIQHQRKTRTSADKGVTAYDPDSVRSRTGKTPADAATRLMIAAARDNLGVQKNVEETRGYSDTDQRPS